MTFFNKREDVIKIELTPHGRKLLSNGKLKPHYYAFFDDDVLYDTERGGFTENCSQIKNRILNETPYCKPQTNYKGVETNIFDDRTIEIGEHMLYPIGTNRIEQKDLNGWDVTFLHNTASSATSTDTTQQTLNIPQVNATITYELLFSTQPVVGAADFTKLDFENDDSTDRYLNLVDEQILLNILETNGFNQNEGLELEFFLFEQDKSTFKKLQMFEEENVIVDDMYLEEISNNNKIIFENYQKNFNPNHVEYWLNVKVDDQVSLLDRCTGLKNLEANDIYLEGEVICPDESGELIDGKLIDIYSPTISELEDCED